MILLGTGDSVIFFQRKCVLVIVFLRYLKDRLRRVLLFFMEKQTDIFITGMLNSFFFIFYLMRKIMNPRYIKCIQSYNIWQYYRGLVKMLV